MHYRAEIDGLRDANLLTGFDVADGMLKVAIAKG